MSRIVFFCIPAHGHTNPTLGVVRELTARGHQVWYYSYSPFREAIEAAGAVFVPCDDYDLERKLSAKDAARIGKDLALSTRVLVDTTLALGDMACANMERIRPDCIVADSMAVWGKAVAIKLGIPFVSSTTTFAFNQQSARIMKQTPAELLRMIFSLPEVNRNVKRLQKNGYPFGSILDILQNSDDTHTVVYTSPEFQPCADSFSDRFAFVGPSIRPATATVEKKRDKLVYISMGTVNNAMLPLYKRCVRALADTPHQVILSVGASVSGDVLGELPENVSAFSHVDQIAVLQKADAFLSHCGMNSASESLYFGVPLITLPQTPEQRGVAERVLQLGAGLRLERTDCASIARAVGEALDNPSYKQNAAAIADSFARCPGAKGAADKILQVCRGESS